MRLFHQLLNDYYEQYQEKSIVRRRFKHKDIVPLLLNHKNKHVFTIHEAGKSVENREIYLLKAGTGKNNILIWSQMHGNEPTATQALLDIFNFFDTSDELDSFRKTILEKTTLYFLPMLNPDGAEYFKRENALNIDINRDALRLSCPESKILKNLRDEINADFGFNLHDQSIYFRTGSTPHPATIALLSPSFNYQRKVNSVRENSMKVIVGMKRVLQQYIPYQVAKYNDDFEPRAFGDNMQKWGTATILVESGGYSGDTEKQFVRKLNFISIISAFHSIATETYKFEDLREYNILPPNKKESLFDLIIRNAILEKEGKKYKIDIAINRIEQDNITNTDFTLDGRIIEFGDMTVYRAYEDFNAEGFTICIENNELIPLQKADFHLKKDDKIVYEIKNGFLLK